MISQSSIILSSLLTNFHDLDISLLRGIYENRNIFFDPFFIAITNTTAIVSFGPPLLILIIGLLSKNKLLWKNALAILLSVVISSIVANVLKFSFNTPRPYEVYPFIEKLSTGGSPSFPSGHTTDAFAFAVATALIFSRWYVTAPLLIWAGLVGLSRMWLGVHFPSDVLGGAVIGTVCASCYFLLRNRRKSKEPSPPKK